MTPQLAVTNTWWETCNHHYTMKDNNTGVIVLGPTRDEAQILKDCCHTKDVTYLEDANKKPCQQIAECPVSACDMGNKIYACVSNKLNDLKLATIPGCSKQERSGAGTVQVGGRKTLVGVMFVVLVQVLQVVAA